MNWHYDDRDPVSERIHEHIENSAAVRLMGSGRKKEDKPPKEVGKNWFVFLACAFFVILYLSVMLLATKFVKQEFEVRFKRNAEAVVEYLAQTVNEETDFLNYVYEFPITEERYQQFAAAVYDVEGKCRVVTGEYLCVESEGNTYYFTVDDYFKGKDKTRFYTYASMAEKLEVKFEASTGRLHQLVFYRDDMFSDGGEIWKWENKKIEKSKEELCSIMRGKKGWFLSSPSWENDEYLLGVKNGVNFEVEPYQAELDGGLRVVVRTSAKPMAATLDVLTEAYVVGAVVTLLAVLMTIAMGKRIKQKKCA